MLVHKSKNFSYYYYDTYETEITIEIINDLETDYTELLNDIITAWLQYPSTFGDRPLTEFITHELSRKGINHIIHID